MNKTRGIRNNNPGNIRISQNKWQGKVPTDQNTDGAFEQFSAMKYGIRALYRLLITYLGYGLQTVDEIIDRYAPSGDNSEQARNNYKQYAREVVGGNEISSQEDFLNLAKAIMIFENKADQYENFVAPFIDQAKAIANLDDLPLPAHTVKKKI